MAFKEIEMKNTPSVFVIAALALMLFASKANAQYHVACINSTNTHRATLDNKYELEGVRGFYTLTGPHALLHLADVNTNSIPDIVEDAVLHAVVVRKLFASLGFRDPVESPRFRSANVLDLDFLNMPTAYPDNATSNALSFSSVTRVSGVAIREEKCGLNVAFNTAQPEIHDFIRGFLIPHELFHHQQYAYTMFRVGWFLEGMASWSEWSIVKDGPPTNDRWNTPLPATYAELNSLLFSSNGSYDGRKFWGRLAYLTHPLGIFFLPCWVSTANFENNATVVRDDVWRGFTVMKTILQALEAEADVASLELGLVRYQWPLTDQRDVAHNHRIVRAVQRVALQLGAENPEISAFAAIPLP